MIVWQTYRTKDLPAPAKIAQRTWRRHAFDGLHLADDEQVDAFMGQGVIRAEFGTEAQRVLRAFPLGVMRADLWRWCILYAHGGIYADVDCVCLADSWVWADRFPPGMTYIGLENDRHLCNWCMVSPTPGSPVIGAIIEAILRRAVDEGIDTSDPHFVHRYTGPGIVTEAVSRAVLKQPSSAGETPFRSAGEMWLDQQANPHHWKSGGVELLSHRVFAGEMAANQYGSQNYGDGWASWTQERNTMPDRGVIRV
jgi:mannosyltransferase OCH1-like enzyme